MFQPSHYVTVNWTRWNLACGNFLSKSLHIEYGPLLENNATNIHTYCGTLIVNCMTVSVLVSGSLEVQFIIVFDYLYPVVVFWAILFGWWNREEWNGRGMWNVWEGVEKLKERGYLEDPGVDGRIILRCIFRKWNVSSWTGLIWIRLGTGGGHLWMQ